MCVLTYLLQTIKKIKRKHSFRTSIGTTNDEVRRQFKSLSGLIEGLGQHPIVFMLNEEKGIQL